MLHIPILRFGQAYESVDQATLTHHASRAPIARMSLANSGLIGRDLLRADRAALERWTVDELLAIAREAGERFEREALPLGGPDGPRQTFEEYLGQLSATTGMPISYCRNNAAKIKRTLCEMREILAGLTRGMDLGILDRGHGEHGGRTLSFFREGRLFGAVLPSNSPGVHSLWIPAFALKALIVLKPGREEPWTPLRVISSLIAAGAPAEAFGFYPAEHSGANEVLRLCDRSMLFGDAGTTQRWKDDPRVERHGPGFSKIILGADAADDWESHLELMVSSICANGGRSCINASAIWTPRHGREIAEALAQRMAKIKPLPADDPAAELAAFANPHAAVAISQTIDHGLREPGAEDVTQRLRGGPRLARVGEIAYLLPTIIRIDPAGDGPPGHPLTNREFLFPYASVIEAPLSVTPAAIGPTLVATVITRDEELVSRMMSCGHVDRLNLGPIPTWSISWDQPHEGNLFEHLYRQRAFQKQSA